MIQEQAKTRSALCLVGFPTNFGFQNKLLSAGVLAQLTGQLKTSSAVHPQPGGWKLGRAELELPSLAFQKVGQKDAWT